MLVNEEAEIKPFFSGIWYRRRGQCPTKWMSGLLIS